jgi:hypothetical protein
LYDHFSTMRLLFAVVSLLLLLSCTDRDAPKPVPVPRARAAAPSPTASPADPDDPAEPGISDIARLARYVFKSMQAHQEVCPFDNPFRERLHFGLAVDVKAGRITRVGLGSVGVEPAAGADARTLARPKWPRELAGYVTCIGPHLEAVEMDPAPADGSYEPAYTFSGRADGRAAP